MHLVLIGKIPFLTCLIAAKEYGCNYVPFGCGPFRAPQKAYLCLYIYSPEIDSNGAMLNSASDLIYPSLERVVFSHRRWEGDTVIPHCTVAREEETPAEI